MKPIQPTQPANFFPIPLLTMLAMIFVGSANAATLYVDLNSPNPTPPYSDWSTAATNIQDAIDAALAGETVLVTNGIYTVGGKVKSGDLTNRVALDKPIVVQSVNGPWVTTIQGVGAVNGTAAVRCAWVTNGAALVGFTLTGGATRTAGSTADLRSGGGVWCASTNATVSNCIIISNTASSSGGGIFQGSLNNSLVRSNAVSPLTVGIAYNANLLNSTIVNNTGFAVAGAASKLTNCIVYFNPQNYSGASFAYSCTTPLPAGEGNFTNDPGFFLDGVHLASTSACRFAGTNFVSGTDLFGQTWANPPSVGCSQWQPAPWIGIQPKVQLTNNPTGFRISTVVSGQEPLTCFWLHAGIVIEDDGHFSSAHTTNLIASGIKDSDAGSYQVVVSNALGVVTSALAQVTIHLVEAAGLNPVPPYLDWPNAATNIQDAIDASVAGEIVLVTNGVYASGGKVMGGDLTNRVALDKALTMQSVNGPSVTFIQGFWNPTVTNGSAAVRCAWLTNGAVLSGFTLRGGATRAIATPVTQQMNGGGVWGSSTNATVNNCVITGNTASSQGGGAYQLALSKCSLIGNAAIGSGTPGTGIAGAGSGGGAANCNLKNCVVTGNTAVQSNGGATAYSDSSNCSFSKNSASLLGGGAYYGTLISCTITGNITGGYGGYGSAMANATLKNCIVYGNIAKTTSTVVTNYLSCTFTYCDTDPLPAGTGNIDVDPQLLADGVHLSETSPCRGAGTNLAFGTDIDGQAWSNPPSIGCDEWWPSPTVAPGPELRVIPGAHSFTVNTVAAGQTPFTFHWLKDGALIQDDSHYGSSGTANLTVNKFGPDDAGGYQVVVSNAVGVATSAVAQATIHCVDVAGTNPLPPYSSWATAATNIQAAIDAADIGEIVLVTNGVYGTGGKVKSGDLTNRVAVDKALTVVSVNGFASTVIQGATNSPVNGAAAVRCVWLADGAVLGGFTLRNGGTRTGGYLNTDASGGGFWGASSNALLFNCLLTNNTAVNGGGAAYGTVVDSIVTGNTASAGGGAYSANVINCTVVNNSASGFTDAGGTEYGMVRNSIVVRNSNTRGFTANYYTTTPDYAYCCTYPLTGSNNLAATVQFLDPAYHLPAVSPCRGAGSPLYATGVDNDGEPWANPPSIGCDEVVDANLTGPLFVTAQWAQTNLVNRLFQFAASVTGRAARLDWSLGDGNVVTNAGWGLLYTYTNVGDFTVTLTAFNSDNPAGVSASIPVEVLPLAPPALLSAGVISNAFRFSFSTQYGAKYTIQYATNLAAPASWFTFQTIYFSLGGTTQINDGAWTNSARFYRVLVE